MPPGQTNASPTPPAGPITPSAPLSARQRAAFAAQLRLRQTLLPPTLTLAVTLAAAAVGWFALDRRSLLRDNALGLALPAGLAAAASLFAWAGVAFAFRCRTLRRRLAATQAPAIDSTLRAS